MVSSDVEEVEGKWGCAGEEGIGSEGKLSMMCWSLCG